MIEPDRSEVKAVRIVLHYRSAGRIQPHKRTIKLPPSAHEIRAVVDFEMLFSHSFQIPVEAVEKGLAEWFQRTETEMEGILAVE